SSSTGRCHEDPRDRQRWPRARAGMAARARWPRGGRDAGQSRDRADRALRDRRSGGARAGRRARRRRAGGAAGRRARRSPAGARLVIEQRIAGREVSVLAITDGKHLELLPAVEDHKTIFDDDRGPNTGGMGTVSPAWTTDVILERVRREILEPTVRGLAADG